MSPYFLPVVFIAVLLFVVVVGILVFILQYKTHKEQTASYERQLVNADEKYIDLLGRVHAEKNYAPPGVDLQAGYEERQRQERARQVERRNGGPITNPTANPIGPVDTANELALRDLRVAAGSN